MQPTYQVPWERLSNAHRQLMEAHEGTEVLLRPIFFLCGLKFNFTYYKAAHGGTDANATHYSASHLLDDGLDDACRRGLKCLLKLTRSRTHREIIPAEIIKTHGNPDWLFLRLAFNELDSNLRARANGWPATAQAWLRKGDATKNWIRLSFGMGVRALWDDNSFAVKMMRGGGFAFCSGDGHDITTAVNKIVSDFEWNAEWTLAEL